MSQGLEIGALVVEVNPNCVPPKDKAWVNVNECNIEPRQKDSLTLVTIN